MTDIEKYLGHYVENPQVRSLTAGTDLEAAKLAFKRLHEDVVITKVDKASNCLGIMCKTCYGRVAKAELEEPGYEMVDELHIAQEDITQRHLAYVTSEHLPVPKVSKVNNATGNTQVNSTTS